jgi:hypothetical protein
MDLAGELDEPGVPFMAYLRQLSEHEKGIEPQSRPVQVDRDGLID